MRAMPVITTSRSIKESLTSLFRRSSIVTSHKSDAMEASGWSANTRRRYVLILGVVCVTALGSATLFAFAGLTEQERGNSDNGKNHALPKDKSEDIEVIKQAFDEMQASQHAPGPYSPSSAPLLCRFSPNYRGGVYPYGVCTHFIYASVANHQEPGYHGDKNVLYGYDQNAFKKFLHVRETAADVRLLLSVEIDAMLRTEWTPDHLAADAKTWMDRSSVDGLHLAGLDLLPRNIDNVTKVITALRDAFKTQYLLTIGVDRTQKTVESKLLDILRLSDFASFRTSRVRHTDERTTLTNPFSKYDNSTSVLFLNYEVERLAKLAAKMPRSRVCFTLTIGGNQFELEDASQHGLGAPARHTKDVSYADICKQRWDEVRYIRPAMGYYVHRGRTWIGYDTEKTIAAKVRKALQIFPGFCVMLVQVDRDDYKGTCSEKHFPLAQSVKHVMNQFQHSSR